MKLERNGVTLWYQVYQKLLPLTRRSEKLPTEKALAARYGVSKNTIRGALKHLRGEGRIVTVRGGRSTPL
jgi:DNA-binding GntR family transcriptional regulator